MLKSNFVFYYRMKPFVPLLATTVIILSMLLFGSSMYLDHMKQILKTDVNNALMENTDLTQLAIKSQMESDLRHVNEVAELLEETTDGTPQALYNAINHLKSPKLHRYGVILPDGKGYAEDIKGIDFSDRDYFKKAMQGESNISAYLSDRIKKTPSVTFAAPVKKNGQVVAVLAFVKRHFELSPTLSYSPFSKSGYYLITASDNSVIIPSDHANYNLETEYDKPATNASLVQALKEAEDTGVVKYETKNGEMRYCAFMPLGINDWKIMSIVPTDIVNKHSEMLLNTSRFTWACLILLFLSISVNLFVNKVHSQKTIDKLVAYDPLTNLYNFNMFKRKYQNVVSGYRNVHALVIFDIKGFKLINEMYGFEFGDIMLKRIAEEITQTFDNDELYGRISADSFVLLLRCADKEIIEQRLLDFYKNLKKTDIVQGITTPFEITFGVSIVDSENSVNIQYDRTLFAHQKAKRHPETCVTFYDDDLRTIIARESELNHRAHYALTNNEFIVYLQPQVELNTERVIGAEALIRWEIPDKGVRMPQEFIPYFEKNGFIEKIDLYMFESVCRILKKWTEEGMETISISVNISRPTLFRENIAIILANIATRIGVPTTWIELEVTESIAFEHVEMLPKVFVDLKKCGFRIAMDDFGSGYSSLNMLKDFPIDVMKLDKEFLHSRTAMSTPNQERTTIILDSLLALAKELNITIVAEGIEFKHQAMFLKRNGCDFGQGYLFSKPIPVAEFDRFLKLKNKI